MAVARGHDGAGAISIGRVSICAVGQSRGAIGHGLLPEDVGFVILARRIDGCNGLAVGDGAHARRPRAVAIHRRRRGLGDVGGVSG